MDDRRQIDPPPATPHSPLLHNLLLFGRLLRGLGMDVSPGRMVDTAQTLNLIQIGVKSDFYYALRSLLTQKKEELPLFDEAFARFWRKPSGEILLDELIFRPAAPQKMPAIIPAQLPQSPPPNDTGDTPDDELETVWEITQTYSRRELLRGKDFSQLSGEELYAIKQLILQLAWQMGERRTRRKRPGDGAQLDLRRGIRRNFRYGGEALEWMRRQPRYKPRPLVIIADVSGSMERYSRLLLHFSYSLSCGLSQRVEAFVFSSRLTRITRQLGHKDVDRALANAGNAIPDWSGGTRIGEALKRFNFDWGRRVLRGGAIVLLISDGWDRGEPELLAREMARLQRSCRRLIWLNPLLGSANYEPLTRGMVAALPYVDDFMPVHNLASLEQLGDHLGKLYM